MAVVAIVNGDYYSPAKLAELNRYGRNNPPKSFACNIGDIPDLIKRL